MAAVHKTKSPRLLIVVQKKIDQTALFKKGRGIGMLFAFWTFPCLMLVLVSFPISSEGLSFILKQLPVCLLFF